MAVAEPETAQRTARQILRAFIHDVINGDPEFRTSDVLDAAHRSLGNDPEFQAAVVRDAIDELAPTVLMEIMRGTRSRYVPTATGGISKAALDLTARERLGRMFERTGTGYASILAMDYTSGLVAYQERLQQVRGHMPFIGWWEETLPKLKRSGKTVGDTFTARELDGLWKRHFETE